MIIEGLHEKEIFDEKFPLRLLINQNVDFNYPAHWHNAIELLYVVENSFNVVVNYKEYRLRQRDILFIPSGDIHEFASTTPTGTRIFINFDISSLNTYGDTEWIRSQLNDVKKLTPEENPELHMKIESEILKMEEECKAANYTRNLFLTSRMIDILVLLCQNTISQINIENLGINKQRISGLEKINKSFEYIEKNYGEDISLKDVSKAAGFSEFYFSRLFKEITEKNFHQYLNEYRLRKAESLLTDSNCSISEVAYAVGFSSIATFDRLFRKVKGCSPKEYRKLKHGL